jgi:hypothetical protein
MDRETLVSIVITAHNYGRFLDQAITSALAQTYQEIEVVIVDDGSVDETPLVLSKYRDTENVRQIRLPGVGLATAANYGITGSSGGWIIRLDADDWFDENLVLVLASHLKLLPEVGFVFPDYYSVDVDGAVIATHRRLRINQEVELLDRPSLAAGAMFRRSVWEQVGGYNEKLSHQEDYDFWIKLTKVCQVKNVSLPLMYYRQHPSSMSKSIDSKLKARQLVKRDFVSLLRDSTADKVLGVIEAHAQLVSGAKLPLVEFSGITLLERAVRKLTRVNSIGQIIVYTDDSEIAEAAYTLDIEVCYGDSIASPSRKESFEALLSDLFIWMGSNEGDVSEKLVILQPQVPFILTEHIVEALDTQQIFQTDSVIVVFEDKSYYWRPGRFGLEQVGYREAEVQLETEIMYREVCGLQVIDLSRAVDGEISDQKVGHIEVAEKDSIRISDEFTLNVALDRQKREVLGL